jgi:hypothetical protein
MRPRDFGLERWRYGQGQQQIPFGDDNQRTGNGKNKCNGKNRCDSKNKCNSKNAARMVGVCGMTGSVASLKGFQMEWQPLMGLSFREAMCNASGIGFAKALRIFLQVAEFV